MKYNQLKTIILELLAASPALTSREIFTHLEGKIGSRLSTRAVRMALLRYHRQGLLHREWRSGEYVYMLSNKGSGRLLWLKSLTD